MDSMEDAVAVVTAGPLFYGACVPLWKLIPSGLRGLISKEIFQTGWFMIILYFCILFNSPNAPITVMNRGKDHHLGRISYSSGSFVALKLMGYGL
jgi:hypothetical protein